MASTDKPRIILPLLPSPKSRTATKKHPIPLRARHLKVEGDDLDRFQRIQCRAIGDMKQLVGHVSSLLESPEAEQAGICDWLANIDSNLDEIEGYIRDGLYQCDLVTIESDGISSLGSLLDAQPELGDESDEDDSESSPLLPRLVSFWTCEIVSRGYELICLLCGSISLLETEKDFSILDRAHYPSHEANAGWFE